MKLTVLYGRLTGQVFNIMIFLSILGSVNVAYIQDMPLFRIKVMAVVIILPNEVFRLESATLPEESQFNKNSTRDFYY